VACSSVATPASSFLTCEYFSPLISHLAPDPGALQAPDPGALQAPDPGALQAPDPGALEAPDPGALQLTFQTLTFSLRSFGGTETMVGRPKLPVKIPVHFESCL
jgi:hypothetical protein